MLFLPYGSFCDGPSWLQNIDSTFTKTVLLFWQFSILHSFSRIQTEGVGVKPPHPLTLHKHLTERETGRRWFYFYILYLPFVTSSLYVLCVINNTHFSPIHENQKFVLLVTYCFFSIQHFKRTGPNMTSKRPNLSLSSALILLETIEDLFVLIKQRNIQCLGCVLYTEYTERRLKPVAWTAYHRLNFCLTLPESGLAQTTVAPIETMQ